MKEFFIVIAERETAIGRRALILGREDRTKEVPADNLAECLHDRYHDRALSGWKNKKMAERHAERRGGGRFAPQVVEINLDGPS